MSVCFVFSPHYRAVLCCTVCFVALALCVAGVSVIQARRSGCNLGANCVVCVPVM